MTRPVGPWRLIRARARDQSDALLAKCRRVRFPVPPRDSWVVAVASGDKVTAPFWAMSMPEAIAITNPIFVNR